jgi:hypothetical protein
MYDGSMDDGSTDEMCMYANLDCNWSVYFVCFVACESSFHPVLMVYVEIEC